ncbi:acyltransferase family protein [Bradyrhizobium sp. STM 3566]|uniref:acyltransferase family protein n=1 Tax=Bradyrhizobium sp. STM 3566 TaxID=578928 RepID=UPI00388DAE42
MILGRTTTIGDRFAVLSARGPGFDQIRLVAALMVVAHHAWWGVNDVLYRFSGGFVQLGLLAVVIFFCVSGFLLAPGLARSGDLVRFAVNRALRILPALFAVVVASMFVLGPALTTYSLAQYFSSAELYLYLKNVLTLMSHYLPGVVRHGREVQINGPLWTLNIEVWSYAALAALSAAGFLRRRVLAMISFTVVYLAYVGLALSPALHAICPQRLLDFIGLFVYFIAGTNLYLYRESVPFSGVGAAVAVGFALIALAGGVGAVALPLCVPYLVVYLGLSEVASRVPLKHDLSYGVYLIHSPVILAFLTVFDLAAGWPLALLAGSVTLVLAYASWRFVEAPALKQKVPVSRWVSAHMARLGSGRGVEIQPAARRHEQSNSLTGTIEAGAAE